MDNLIEHFIIEFHNLQGATVADKKKNLYFLLNNHKEHLKETSLLDSLLLKLVPQNHLEKLFFVDFLIYFRRHKELYTEFLKGDDIVVSKVSKQNWFFQEVFKEIGTRFVRDVFPTLSFSLRLKILKKMVPVLSEHQGDEIFEALNSNYGLFIATNIITCCSVSKLEDVLKNQYVKLSPNQLKLIYNKKPSLVLLYLEERERHEGNRKFMDLNPIFKYIAEENVEMYCQLCHKYNLNAKLGKRTTKKLVTIKREQIVANPDVYVKNLNSGRLVRKLGGDFKEVFLKVFPRRIADSPHAESSRLLKYYPKKGRYNLLLTTFDQVFHKKLYESPHLIDDYILRMVVDPNEREKLAKIKAQHDVSEDYSKYLRPSECFKVTKEKINFARASYERGNLLGNLTHCCLINDDYDALLDVLRFAFERFKNDDFEVHRRLLDILAQGGNFEKLTESHWDCLTKIISRHNLRTAHYYNFGDFFFKHIEFLHKNNKPIEEEILKFFEQNDFQLSCLKKMPFGQAQKKLLITLIALIPKMKSPGTSTENIDCKILAACKMYNSHRSDKIDVFEYPRLIQTAKKALREDLIIEEDALTSALEILLCSTNTNEEIDELNQIFWTKIEKFGTPFIINWFLKHKPHVVVQNFEQLVTYCVLNKELNKQAKIWTGFKCYSHFKMEQKIVDLALRKLKDTNSKNPQFWARCLSFFMSSEDYLKLTESYIPIAHKIDPENDEMNKIFQIQKCILKGLNSVKSPLQALPLILKFFKDDYVRYCLSPLYCSFYHSPNDQIKNYIDEINSKGAVSVKKHSYYLTAALCDQPTVLNVFKLCNLTQIVNIVLKYFLKNSSEELWEIFKNKLSYFDGNDKGTSKLLAEAVVARPFKTRYFVTIYDLLPDIQQKKTLINNTHMDTIAELDEEMFLKFTNEFSKTDEVNRIIADFLIGSHIPNKLELIFDSLLKFKLSTQFISQKIYNFVFSFFTNYMKWEGEDLNIVDAFIGKFQEIFPLVGTFEENIILQVMKLKKKPLNTFTESIVQLHNDTVAKYDVTISNAFSNCVKKILPYFFTTELQKYEFYYLMLQGRKSDNDLYLVINLLPSDSDPEDIQSFQFYDNILSQLEEISLSSVQIYMNLHLKFHKVNTDFSYYENAGKFCINTSSWLNPGARRRVGYNYY